MNYKNFSTYVQREINRILRVYRKYVQTHVDDIIIYFRIFKKHVMHFRKIFEIFKHNNIFIKFIKIFIEYFFVRFFGREIDSLNFVTTKNKFISN